MTDLTPEQQAAYDSHVAFGPNDPHQTVIDHPAVPVHLPYGAVDPTPAEYELVRQAANNLREAADTVTRDATTSGLIAVEAAPLAEWLNSAADDATQVGPDPHAVRMAITILATNG